MDNAFSCTDGAVRQIWFSLLAACCFALLSTARGQFPNGSPSFEKVAASSLRDEPSVCRALPDYFSLLLSYAAQNGMGRKEDFFASYFEKIGLTDFYQSTSFGMDRASLYTVGKVAAGAAVAVGGATVALPLLGFGAAGVGAGTIAAGVQASIGNVAAGSTFAALQSAGVVGLATGTQAALAAAGGYVASFF